MLEKTPSSRWVFPANSDKATRLLVALGAAILTYDVFYFFSTFYDLQMDPPGDYFGFWSWGKFAAAHRLAEMYDADAIHASQMVLGAAETIYAPYPYPPLFAAALIPFGFLSSHWSFVAWSALSLVGFVCSVGAGRKRGQILALTLSMPSTLIALGVGQNGLVSGALSIAGFRLAGSRPIIAGVLVGILAFKPQMGILIPFALVAAGMWTVAAAACVTVILEILTIGYLSGWDAWTNWISSGILFTENPKILPLTHLMPTIMATLTAFGVPTGLALIGQAISTVSMACLTWVVFRRGTGTLQACTLFLATFLATPYAFIYDMGASGFATAAFIYHLKSRGETTSYAEMAAIAMAVCIPPMLGFIQFPSPLGVLAVAPLLWFVSRRALANPR